VLASLIRSTLLTSGTKAAGLLMSLGTLSVTAHTLGPTGRGNIAVVVTWVSLFVTFGHLSLGQVALAHAQREEDRTWVGPTMWVFLAFSLGVPAAVAVTVTGCALLGVGTPFSHIPTPYLLVGLAVLPVMMWTTYSAYLLLALDRLGTNNRAQLAGAAAGFAAVLALVVGAQAGVTGALIAVLLSQLVVAAVGLRTLLRLVPSRPRLDQATLRRLARGGAQLHLNAVGAFLFASLNVLMIDHYRGAAEAGLFQVAFQLITPLMFVPQAVTEVLSSKLGTLGPDGLWPAHKRIMILVIAGMTTAAALLALLAPVVVSIVAGTKFDASVPLLRVYLLAIPAMALSGCMAVQWIGRGLFLQASTLTISAGALSLLVNLALIPRYGAEGAAWASVVGVYLIPLTANVLMWRHCNRGAARLQTGTRQLA
jgi:O-antigen/teichoic acid export membrane protein